MANNKKYKYSRGKDGYVVFNSEGYILEADGFGSLMWSSNIDIDKDLIGKHVNELTEMLKKNCIAHYVYINFENQVRIDLFNSIAQQKKQTIFTWLYNKIINYYNT